MAEKPNRNFPLKEGAANSALASLGPFISISDHVVAQR